MAYSRLNIVAPPSLPPRGGLHLAFCAGCFHLRVDLSLGLLGFFTGGRGYALSSANAGRVDLACMVRACGRVASVFVSVLCRPARCVAMGCGEGPSAWVDLTIPSPVGFFCPRHAHDVLGRAGVRYALRSAPECDVPGCPLPVPGTQAGLCSFHRCQMTGCPAFSRGAASPFCVAHGCSELGCPLSARARPRNCKQVSPDLDRPLCSAHLKQASSPLRAKQAAFTGLPLLSLSRGGGADPAPRWWPEATPLPSLRAEESLDDEEEETVEAAGTAFLAEAPAQAPPPAPAPAAAPAPALARHGAAIARKRIPPLAPEDRKRSASLTPPPSQGSPGGEPRRKQAARRKRSATPEEELCEAKGGEAPGEKQCAPSSGPPVQGPPLRRAARPVSPALFDNYDAFEVEYEFFNQFGTA